MAPSDMPFVLGSSERILQVVAEVRQRLLKATSALAKARIPYSVIGGNAAAFWVGTVDKAAVRFTQDVDILLRRDDLKMAESALSAVGLYHERFDGHVIFDNTQASSREAVHIIFANEKVQRDYPASAPDLSETGPGDHYDVLNLEALVRMKLTSFRRVDQVHLLDMIRIGLINATWPSRFPSVLAQRLRELLNDTFD